MSAVASLVRFLKPLPRVRVLSSLRPRRIPRPILPTHLTFGGKRTMATKQDLASLPGVTTEPDPTTKDFFLQQAMLRVKDPKISLDFYTRVMGMSLLTKLDFPEMEFSLYFLGYESLHDVPDAKYERNVWVLRRKGCLELTHNYGTESDPSFSYHSGNSEPKGFGHIGVCVPDVYAACERFEKLGVEFVKTPDSGKMKGIAFIKDPDGYWIEILNNVEVAKLG